MSNDAEDFPIEVLLLVEDDDGCALLLQKQLGVCRYGSCNFRRADRLSVALREVAQGALTSSFWTSACPTVRDSKRWSACVKEQRACRSSS